MRSRMRQRNVAPAPAQPNNPDIAWWAGQALIVTMASIMHACPAHTPPPPPPSHAGVTVWGLYNAEAALDWVRLNAALSPSPTFIGASAYLCFRMFNATTSTKPFTLLCGGTIANVQYLTLYRWAVPHSPPPPSRLLHAACQILRMHASGPCFLLGWGPAAVRNRKGHTLAHACTHVIQQPLSLQQPLSIQQARKVGDR